MWLSLLPGLSATRGGSTYIAGNGWMRAGVQLRIKPNSFSTVHECRVSQVGVSVVICDGLLET